MIICKTPLRISFFGGGSDLPSFYEKEAGCVLSTAIDKYIYLVVHESFDNFHKIAYNQIEHASLLEEIKNPIVREVLKKVGIDRGIEIHSIGEVPAGTGLGSSSSFTVGLLNLLYAYKGQFVSKAQLAKEASDIAITMLKEPIGKQDQYAAAFGGFNFIKFNTDGSVDVEPAGVNTENVRKIKERCMLFYLNQTREASSILAEQKKNILTDDHKFKLLREMKDTTLLMREELRNNKIERFGELLHTTWMLKRKLTDKISTKEIDDFYERGLQAGAQGGKVLGAGGGGFLLFYCEPDKQENLKNALKELRHFSFNLDLEGTRIIYSH